MWYMYIVWNDADYIICNRLCKNIENWDVSNINFFCDIISTQNCIQSFFTFSLLFSLVAVYSLGDWCYEGRQKAYYSNSGNREKKADNNINYVVFYIETCILPYASIIFML